MKTFYILISVLLISTIACNKTSKKESGIWNNRQVKLLKFSANNEYLVIAATKKNDSLNSDDTLTKLFIYKNINKNNSNNRGWSLISETKVFNAWKFETLYLINSKSVALALAQTNLGGAHAMDEMFLYKIDTNGKLEYRREPYEEDGTEPDITEHFSVTVINDSTMTMTRDQGTYNYSLVRNEINRTFISNIEKAEKKGGIVAKYIFSNNKFSAYGQSTFYLKVGQAIIFDGADQKRIRLQWMESIQTLGTMVFWLNVKQIKYLRDFTYTFNKPGNFIFSSQIQSLFQLVMKKR